MDKLHSYEIKDRMGDEITHLKDKILLIEDKLKSNDRLIEKMELDHERIKGQILEHEGVLRDNETSHEQYNLTKKLIQGWRVQDDGDFLNLVNDIFQDNMDTEMLSLCENFIKFRESSLIFKLMGHLWGYMSKLDCVATSHVLSTELTASLGKPASSNPGSLLEEISDTEEDVIIVGGNPTNNVNPRSISAQLVTDGPKIPLINPSLKLKRLERPAVPISKKCRGGRTSKRFKCVPRTLSEIDFCEKLSEVEWVKTDPSPDKVVPEPIILKFDVSK
ncbi:MAG: hypothetical protein GY777_30375, partial [Candidatus Brocadiaceae bacterium]|nr:hypothetical protein [Candidatus Brocadiaceae bacterium]